jgi:transcriptional regulator with XRE-family HTH domain
MTTFGARLKQRREARRWTQQELASRAGIPYMTVYRLETEAHRTPRMDIAVKLARTLGVSLDYLCGVYEDEKAPARRPRRKAAAKAAQSELFPAAVA